jgi:ferrous iron transport protein B
VVIALTMMDIAEQKGVKIDVNKLSQELNTPVVVINPRKNEGILALKEVISQTVKNNKAHNAFVSLGDMSRRPVSEMQEIFRK